MSQYCISFCSSRLLIWMVVVNEMRHADAIYINRLLRVGLLTSVVLVGSEL